MPRSMTMTRPLTASLVLACCGVLIGCDQSGSDSSLKIENAGREISNVSGVNSGDERRSAFNATSSDLRAFATDDNAKDAASVLTAQASAGIAQVALERAHTLSADALGRVASLRGDLEQYIRVSALEQGTANQDLSDQFASLDSKAQQLSDDLDGARSRLAGVEQELARLNDERDQHTRAARDLREQVILMKRDVESASATERQPVLEEAHGLTRRADGFESQAAELSIQIDDASLRRRSLQGEIQLLERQRELNSEARTKTEQMERQVRQSRDKLREQTSELASALLAGYDEALGAYEQGAKESFQEAIAGLSKASGEAQRGSGVPGARMSAANIKLLQATAHTSQGTVELALAKLGDDLVSIVPGATGLRQRLEALRESGTDALSQAADAYDGASAVLDNASERAQAIRVSLGMAEPASDDAGMDDSGDMDDMDGMGDGSEDEPIEDADTMDG